MEVDYLEDSLNNYQSQLFQVSEALRTTAAGAEYDSLVSLQADLRELIDLTKESLDTLNNKLQQDGSKVSNRPSNATTEGQNNDEPGDRNDDPFADEYALFMSEMAKSGAYEEAKENDQAVDKSNSEEIAQAADIEEDLNSLQGMKCAAYHIHKWGGAPTLHNAMVCGVIRETSDGATDFHNIQVRVMYTHPTHREMLPCPFYLDGDCKFSDDQCKFSHGEVVSLSSLQEAVEPNFERLKHGSLILAKLNPTENINLKQPSSEKYLLWHRATVKEVDFKDRTCVVTFDHSLHSKSGKTQGVGHSVVRFEDMFPLQESADDATDSSSSSDAEVPAPRRRSDADQEQSYERLVNRSLINKPGAVQLGDWEKHTRGIGSRIMLAMGYVAGTGLGSEGKGRVEPVPAKVLPMGKSLDHYMDMKEKAGGGDPLKIEKKLKRLQRRQEERCRQAYERQAQREHHDVFNFLNRTLGAERNDSSPGDVNIAADSSLKQSSSKNLNIQRFRIAEDMRRVERDVVRLKNSLSRHAAGSTVHRNLRTQLEAKTNELHGLRLKERDITSEQSTRKDEKLMSEF